MIGVLFQLMNLCKTERGFLLLLWSYLVLDAIWLCLELAFKDLTFGFGDLCSDQNC